jgi:hypothetical protein
VATRNSASGANVRVEVEIVTTGRSIKAHETTPSETLHPHTPSQYGVLLENSRRIWTCATFRIKLAAR